MLRICGLGVGGLGVDLVGLWDFGFPGLDSDWFGCLVLRVGLGAMFGFGLWSVVRVVAWIPLAGVVLFCFRLGFGFIVWLDGVVGCCDMCCFSGCVAVVLGCLTDGGGCDFVALRFVGMYGWWVTVLVCFRWFGYVCVLGLWVVLFVVI